VTEGGVDAGGAEAGGAGAGGTRSEEVGLATGSAHDGDAAAMHAVMAPARTIPILGAIRFLTLDLRSPVHRAMDHQRPR
jgi:hypothetical protein